MQVTILGCGGSGGVPLIGGQWGACDPNNGKNIRTRASILLEQAGETLLIDSAPDLRQHALRENIHRLDAVLFTHAHADHCHGIDELRALNWLMQEPIPIYSDAETMAKLVRRFDYIFKPIPAAELFHRPALIPHIFSPDHFEKGLKIGSFMVYPFIQDHAYINSLGFRIGDFAYSTDVKTLPEPAFARLQGIKTWVVDCARRTPHPTHSHLAQTLEWIARVKPEQAYLTHMSGDLDYATLCAELPPHIRPAYDGLRLEATGI